MHGVGPGYGIVTVSQMVDQFIAQNLLRHVWSFLEKITWSGHNFATFMTALLLWYAKVWPDLLNRN